MTGTSGPAPYDESTVLSPGWLTETLGARYPGAVVTEVAVVERLETVATKVRFQVSYAEPVEGAPTALCAKGYFNPRTHGAMQGRQTEAEFYRDVASGLPVRTPPCVHAAVDPSSGHGLILMRDLKAAGDTFLDPLSSFRPDQAAATLDQLAALHAAHWDRPGVVADAFPPRLGMLAGVLPVELLQTQLDDGRCPDVPATVRQADRVQASVRALGALRPDHPSCLVHGDTHTGNIYLTADGQTGVIDWQVVQWGAWALDVAYHLAAVLDPDERERSERQLLSHYLDRLAAHGVTPPDADDAWWLYRAHLAYGFFMWAITRAVDRPVIEHLTRRLGAAAAHHGSMELLGV